MHSKEKTLAIVLPTVSVLPATAGFSSSFCFFFFGKGRKHSVFRTPASGCASFSLPSFFANSVFKKKSKQNVKKVVGQHNGKW